MDKLWNLLTEDEKAEILLLSAVNQHNKDKERFNAGGAPEITLEEVK